MKFLKLAVVALCSTLALSFSSCDDDNETPAGVTGSSELWGEVLRGDNMTLKFFPDHFAYYWEYTFSAEENPNVGLVIEGEYPDARFLSYNVYDDVAQTSHCNKNYSLLDINIKADKGSENPFVVETSNKGQKYTLYVLPTDAPASISNGKANICWFDAHVKKVCTILRYYLPKGNFEGGVELPKVKAIDLTTGQEVAAPKRILSALRGDMELPAAPFIPNANMPFFRAPFAYAYPNGPAEYCYTRNVLKPNEVMVFNFKAPSFPKRVSEYATSDMRYWSVCVGNNETYTPLAISDSQTLIDAQGFANYVLVDEASTHYAEVKAIAERKGFNLFTWKGSQWNEGVMILYRNMVFADDYAHSMRKLTAVDQKVNPQDIFKNPQKYIAAVALRQWGATGKKLSVAEFIEKDGDVAPRVPNQTQRPQ